MYLVCLFFEIFDIKLMIIVLLCKQLWFVSEVFEPVTKFIMFV